MTYDRYDIVMPEDSEKPFSGVASLQEVVMRGHNIPGTELYIWYCPSCVWYRIRKDTEEWSNKVIQHPLYGHITNYRLYLEDIRHHDCTYTREARAKLGLDPDKRNLRKYMKEGLCPNMRN